MAEAEAVAAAAAVAQVAAGTAAVVVDGRAALAALAARADHLAANVWKISNKQPVAIVLHV